MAFGVVRARGAAGADQNGVGEFPRHRGGRLAAGLQFRLHFPVRQLVPQHHDGVGAAVGDAGTGKHLGLFLSPVQEERIVRVQIDLLPVARDGGGERIVPLTDGADGFQILLNLRPVRFRVRRVLVSQHQVPQQGADVGAVLLGNRGGQRGRGREPQQAPHRVPAEQRKAKDRCGDDQEQ